MPTREQFRFRNLEAAFGSYLVDVVRRREGVDTMMEVDALIDFYAGAQVTLEILQSFIDDDPEVFGKLWGEIATYHATMREKFCKGREQ